MTLRARSARGFFWLAAGNGSQQVVSLLVFIYLARTLEPTDFGIVALAAVFVDLLALLSCFGQMELIQQRRLATIRDSASASFWLIQGFGAVATAALVLAAPAISDLMATPGLDRTLLFLSPMILLTTLGQVPEGLIRREMRFHAIAIRNVAATMASGGAAVATVLAGFPELALVAQKLAYAATVTITLWIACPWRPKLRPSWVALRTLSADGFYIMASNASSQLNTRIIDFIVGLTLGTYWLGQLKIAWRILDFVNQIALAPISSVAASLFGHAAASADRLARNFNETVKAMAIVACPAFLGLAALAPDLTASVLGDKWIHATPLIQLLALLPLTAVINSLYGPLLIAAGRTGQMLALGLFQNILTAGLAAAGAPFGAIAVMLAFAARSYVLAGVNLFGITRATQATLSGVLAAMAPPAVASLVMGVTVLAARGWLAAKVGVELRLILLIAIGGTTYGAVLMLGDLLGAWPHYVRRILTDLKDMIRTPNAVVPLTEAHE